eukprot:11211124-Alexandrium_andersonii.AAC.1
MGGWGWDELPCQPHSHNSRGSSIVRKQVDACCALLALLGCYCALSSKLLLGGSSHPVDLFE